MYSKKMKKFRYKFNLKFLNRYQTNIGYFIYTYIYIIYILQN